MASNNSTRAAEEYARRMARLDPATARANGQKIWQEIARKYGIGAPTTSGNGQDPLGSTGANPEPTEGDVILRNSRAGSDAEWEIVPDGTSAAGLPNVPIDERFHADNPTPAYEPEAEIILGIGPEAQTGAIVPPETFSNNTNNRVPILSVPGLGEINAW